MKISGYAGIDYGMGKSESIPIILNIYPDVTTEHDFEPMAEVPPPSISMGSTYKPFVTNHYQCRKCGLRAIRSNAGRYTLHSQSWKDELTGKETCNELLMRKVLG